MSEKLFMKGNEVIAQAALEAGCRFYAGYPKTPQNEIPEYLSAMMSEVDGVFIQAESELVAINMVYGAAACGVRAMTSSSSPGISLKQEALSFLAGAELPAVIVNMQRGGPGLGNMAKEEIEIDYAGDTIDIGLNVTYLIDVLANMGVEMVRVELQDGNASALITTPEAPGFKYVVMPMRI